MGYKRRGAYAEDGPRLDRRILLSRSLDETGSQRRHPRRRVLPKEVAQLLLLVVVGGRVPRVVRRLALEPVRDQHAVLLAAGRGEDVGALDGLGVEAEDVHYYEDALFGVGGAGGVLLLVSARAQGEGWGDLNAYRS